MVLSNHRSCYILICYDITTMTKQTKGQLGVSPKSWSVICLTVQLSLFCVIICFLIRGSSKSWLVTCLSVYLSLVCVIISFFPNKCCVEYIVFHNYFHEPCYPNFFVMKTKAKIMINHLFDSTTEFVVCNYFFSTNSVLNTLYFTPFFMRLVIRKLFRYEDSFKTIFQLIDEELETYYRLIYFKPINYAHLRKS